jgi:hypothetical protein
MSLEALKKKNDELKKLNKEIEDFTKPRWEKEHSI